MKLKLRVPDKDPVGSAAAQLMAGKAVSGGTASARPAWSNNDIAAFLLLPFDAHLGAKRETFSKAFEETFGVRAPDAPTIWDLRTAVFYEQTLRRMHADGKKADERFLSFHKRALKFQTRIETPKPAPRNPKESTEEPGRTVNVGGSLMTVFHTCGHKVVRGVPGNELSTMESMPCPRCAPTASIADTKAMVNHVTQHSTTEQREGKVMAKKGAKESSVGKGVTGKSGMNKTTFFLTSLKENEKAKKNDVELQKTWDKEFAEGTGRRWLVSEIRHMLNRGHYKANALAGFESHEFGAPEKKEAPAKVKAAPVKAAPAKAKGKAKATAPAKAEPAPTPTPMAPPRLKLKAATA